MTPPGRIVHAYRSRIHIILHINKLTISKIGRNAILEIVNYLQMGHLHETAAVLKKNPLFHRYGVHSGPDRIGDSLHAIRNRLM